MPDSMRLYYKPDSEAAISPVELEFDERTYTYEEAMEVWREKGCELSASTKPMLLHPLVYSCADFSK